MAKKRRSFSRRAKPRRRRSKAVWGLFLAQGLAFLTKRKKSSTRSRRATDWQPWLAGFSVAALAVILVPWIAQHSRRAAVPVFSGHPATPTHGQVAGASKRDTVPEARPASRAVAPVSVPPALARQFARAAEMTIPERVHFWGKYFNGGAHPPSVLRGIQPAPESRDTAPWVADRFDCTTFVESVMALATSDGAADFYPRLMAIRYRDGDASFQGRNHFPEADWVPNNASAGNIEDVTAHVARAAGVVAGVERKTIDRGAWFARTQGASRSIASTLDESWKRPVETSVQYVPIDAVNQVVSHLPDGAVINLVRKSRADKDVLISHQGFIVRSGGTALLRHSTAHGTVKTLALAEYLRRHQSTDWPILGLNVNVVRH